MKILALDASANVVSAAIVQDGVLIGEYTVNHRKTHSQTLMPMISDILKMCETDISDIDVVAVSKGPGSFTGLRIGVETAKALAHGINKPVIGVDTTFAMAHNLIYCGELIVPIMDARRNQVYSGIYESVNGKIETLMEKAALGIDELAEKLLKMKRKCVFLGDGVLVHRQYLKNKLGELSEFAYANNNMQRAASVAVAALSGNIKPDTYLSLEPVYLRKSQAEREYEEKSKAMRK